MADLPAEVIAQLSCIPAEDFVCAICQRNVDRRWNPKDANEEFPPICRNCETLSHYGPYGQPRHRTRPTAGSFRDRRMALRIGALADALVELAANQKWSKPHGRP